MIALLLSLALIFAPLQEVTGHYNKGPSGGTAPSFVQEKDGATAAAVTSLTVTFGSNVASGNSIVCATGWSGAATFTSLQDGTSANFTAIDSTTASGTTKTFWLASSSGGASASAITITISAQSSGSDLNLMCQEWHGATTLDVHAINSQSFPGTGANALTSGSVTTTGSAGDGCAGFENNNGGTSSGFSAGTTVAWTAQNNPGHAWYFTEEFVQSSAGSIAATFTSTAGGGIVSETAIACLK